MLLDIFGGILLGTGGLVRAYSEALNEALNNADIVEKDIGYEIEIIIEYEDAKDFEYFCTNNDIKIIGKEYTEKIKYLVEISKNNYDKNVEKNLIINYQNLPIKIIREKFIVINGKTC